MAYIGPAPNPGQNREVDDISSGFNGSEVNFTLQVNSQNVSPGSSNAIIVSLGGVVQNPGTDYTVAASTLTFTTAPASGLSFFGLVLGQQVDTADANFNDPVITGDLSIADKIVHTGDTNNAIRFPAADTITAETAGSERLRVDSSGRLLIGTTNNSNGHIATSNLAVQGADLAIFKDSGGDNSGVSGHKLKLVTQSGSLGEIDVLSEGAGGPSGRGGAMRFYTKANNTGSASERMRIDSSGQVGIGVTPVDLLHLKFGTNLHMRFHDDVDSLPTISSQQDADAYNGFGLKVDNLRIQTGTTPAERIRVASSGSIQIHQNTSEVPGLANTVVGACFEKVGTNGSALFVSRADSICTFLNRNNTGEIITFRQSGSQVGSISTNGSSLPSDRNFKKNITDLTLGLDFVNTLKPSKFNLKLEEDTAPLLFGLIAQDVEESLTAAGVTKNSTVLCQHKPTESETESDYNLDYGKLTPILINAVKELSAKITTLETKVAALEAA